MKTLAEILKEKRKQLGLTQKDLAKLVNVDKCTVSNWEKGCTFPNILVACSIADVLNCTLDELIGRCKCETITKND
jgi:DNA-binding XRE family transcriptional regulator